MASFFGLDPTKNYSLYSVPAALGIALAPHFAAINSSLSLYDNTTPRCHLDVVNATQTLDNKKKARIARMQAASDNGFETLGFYAAGVAAANHAGVDPATLNRLTFLYLLSRVAYTFMYITVEKKKSVASWVRTLFWLFGIGAGVSLWTKAGQILLK